MKNQLFLVLALLLFFLNSSFAQHLSRCNPTSEVMHDEIPEYFSPSNDLHKNPTSLFAAQGEKIYISGKITDENCVPIIGALVSIWHTNSKGIYQFTQDADLEADSNETNKPGVGIQAGQKTNALETLKSKVHTDIKNSTKSLSAAALQKSVIDNTNKLHKVQNELHDQELLYDPYFIGTGVSVTDNTGRYGFITIFPGKDVVTSKRMINMLITHSNFSPFETSMYFSDETMHDATLIAKNSTNNTYVFDIVLKGKNSYLKY